MLLRCWTMARVSVQWLNSPMLLREQLTVSNPIAWPFSCMWTRQVKSLRTQDTEATVVVPKYEDIDTAVIEFLKLARDRGMPVTGPMLRTLAEGEASANGVEGIKASEGWLSEGKARHGICGRAPSGDAAGVKKVFLENWEEEFPRIIWSYKPEDIYNLDETGLLHFNVHSGICIRNY